MQNGKKHRNRLAILQSLRESTAPLHSGAIALDLQARGIDLNERSVRLYLQELEDQGLTTSKGRSGHQITQLGLEELRGATVMTRVGFMSAHLDAMTYRMSFDLATRKGSVIVNMSLVPVPLMHQYLEPFTQVFAQGYSMGTLMGLLHAGESLGTTGIKVPEGHVGVCTVASVTLNGVLLRHGVPVRSLSSGLLDLVNGKPHQVAEWIAYDATSIDPLHLLISAGMTSYLKAIDNGNGRIGVGFREIPAESHGQVTQLAKSMRQVGLGAFLEIGKPNQNLLNMPVQQGSCGVIVIGGLNPVAVFVESGHRIQNFPVCSTMEYHELFHFSELKDRLA